MLELTSQVLRTALLIVAALIPIINPPGGAALFLMLTQGASQDTRRFLARKIATNASALILGAMFIGSYVLDFLGVSSAVVRVAGGLLVASFGWQTLKSEDSSEDDPQRRMDWSGPQAGARAFYPLTFPLTVGPGTIAVAITLGASAYEGGHKPLTGPIGAVLATLAIAALIYVCFRYAHRLIDLLGQSGTNVFLRFAAFAMLCVGVQICWEGLAELLKPWRPL
ncbi:MarC family protein [Niveibacterium sp. SC-1]|uniref:MarC family protein n=1 Tax=Niveibacterium sp. SC-1 TaxID=3135646 RepID=UPI00311E79BC